MLSLWDSTCPQGLLLHVKELKRDSHLKELELEGSKDRCSELIKDLKVRYFHFKRGGVSNTLVTRK